MITDFEERVMHNPMLGAILLWEFTRKYEEPAPITRNPSLLTMLPVLPIVFHEPSIERLKAMRFESGLKKYILDEPTSTYGLQERIVALAPLTLASINLACASGLIRKLPLTDELVFASALPKLPETISPKGHVASISAAARRLGAYFRTETHFGLEAKLGVHL